MFTMMTTTVVAIATLLSTCDGGFIDRSMFRPRPPVGCRHAGRLYLPGTTISRDRANNHCYGAYCDHTSNIIPWDNWNCHTTTPPPTTPPTTAPHGCLFEGNWYPLGSEISTGKDRGANWCWFYHCSETGEIIHGDDFNCFTTTTPPTTVPPGCFYEGSWHPFGSMITSGKDRASNWCWSVHCSWDGQILHGDDFNCFPSSSTTVPPTTVPPTTRPTTP